MTKTRVCSLKASQLAGEIRQSPGNHITRQDIVNAIVELPLGTRSKKLILMGVILVPLREEITVECHLKAQVDFQRDQMGEA